MIPSMCMICWIVVALFDQRINTGSMDKKYKITDEHRENLRLSHLGQKSWNKGTVGLMPEPWNKGVSVHLSPKTEFKKGMVPWNKGKKLSFTHRENLRTSHIGLKQTPETIERRRASARRGKSHHAWMGDVVGYDALHTWIKREFGPPIRCDNKSCVYPRMNARGVWMDGPARFEWSNVSGLYTREREDWQMLCPSCHRKFDRK